MTKTAKEVIIGIIEKETGETLDKTKVERIAEGIVEEFGLGKAVVLMLDEVSNDTFNPFDPVLDVLGEAKEEFVEKLSSIMEVRIIEKDDNHIRLMCGAHRLSDEEKEEVLKQYKDILSSLRGDVQMKYLDLEDRMKGGA